MEPNIVGELRKRNGAKYCWGIKERSGISHVVIECPFPTLPHFGTMHASMVVLC
ncbi:hypothetical protein J1N35_028632 [Gossypium stocksii]|uniref:Uncharacterized protein n=1 Tax=Gossypium stocksii TaxID=47602 RepID=A0A9D3UWD9_9ROSI|nr:hypothetical protein J1N35_028632 [Gossypium stocksii]